MQRFLFFIVGLSVLAAGCSDSSSPTDPSTGSSSTTTFTVPLSSANEVPAIANADAGATGTAVVRLVVTRDSAGTITAASANFEISVTGFPNGTRITDAHIHGGAAGSNAGVVVNVGLTAGELAITNGAGSISKTGVNVAADRAAAILSNPGGHYLNVHTALNPDGAVRGQLGPGVTTADPVPGGGY